MIKCTKKERKNKRKCQSYSTDVQKMQFFSLTYMLLYFDLVIVLPSIARPESEQFPRWEKWQEQPWSKVDNKQIFQK